MIRPGLCVMLLLATMTACATGNPRETKGNDVSPSNPRETAQQVLASAKLALPGDATGVTVDLNGYQDFRHVALVRFTAPRASVVSMCEKSGGGLKKIFALADYEKALLGGVTPAADDQLCTTTSEYGRGIAANMLVPANDPAKVSVSVFQLPVR